MNGRHKGKSFSRFQPDGQTVKMAVERYLQAGGKITKIEFTQKVYEDFMAQKEADWMVDDFLLGEKYF